MPRTTWRRLGAVLSAVALVLAACSDDDGGASPDTTEPVETATSTTAGSDDTGSTEPSTVETDDDDGTGDGAAPTTTASGSAGELALVAFDGVEIEPTACRFALPDGQEPECHWLTVPQDWADGEGAEGSDGLRLHAAVFTGAAADAPPTLFLVGGPGRATLDELAGTFDSTIAPLLAHGDVVVLDQRGSGLSEPALQCPEVLDAVRTLDSPATPAGADTTEPLSTAAATCAERLVDAGIDLAAYNSLASAADLDALRDALGIEEWNVYGVRYGTRLAQTYVREFGDTVRSLVLDAPYGLDADPIATAAAGESAVEQLFADCAADPGCAERYPGLGERFEELRTRLDADPLVFTSTDIGSGGVELRADGRYLYDTVLGTLRSRELLATVPRLIETVEDGDATVLSVLAALDADREAEIAFGQHLSVLCNEEAPFTDAEPDPLYAAACPGWESGDAPDVENEALQSDVPTLVLAGQFDATSPAGNGTAVGDGLTTAHVVELAGVGGGAIGNPCPDTVVASFLADPATAPDTSCVAAMSGPTYATGDIGTIELEDSEVDFFGALVTTVRPVGWDLVRQAGGFARMRDVLDPTGIFTLAVPEVPVDDVARQLSGQGEFQLVEGPTLDAGGRTWQRFDAETPEGTLTMAGTVEDGTTIVVVLEALPDERDALVDAVLMPVLETIDVTVG